jgi:hypothetical protein
MISLTCTKCRATLNIDDAFAGGVCRCQHCGTIQTVPSSARGTGQSSGAIHQAASGGTSKALYQSRKQAVAPGSGLEELGEIIASSGLSSSRLRQPMKPDREPPPAVKPPRFSVNPVLAGSVAAGVVGLILVLWLLAGRDESGGARQQPREAAVVQSGGAGDAARGPNFAGIPLRGDEVVYVLDRGASSRESLGDVKEAVLRSIASLGKERRFRIVFWDNGGIESWPPVEVIDATPENVEAARRAIADVSAFGATSARAAIESAAKNKPDEIVLVTAKGWDLNEEFVKMAETALGSAGSRVHTVSIGEASAALQSLSEETGGTAVALSLGELRVAGK